jgi:mono/diheme cytochrome c family protein
MPAVGYLTERQLNTLIDFILNPLTTEMAVKVSGQPSAAAPVFSVITNPQPSVAPPSQGAAVVMVGDGGHGKILFDGSCQSCHGKNAKGGLANPGSTAGKVPPLVPIALRLFNRDPLLFAENIDRFVQLGSIPAGPAPMLRMPAFGATRALTQEQLANIEAYVLTANGVDRAKILEAGILPRTFAKWTTALFGLAFLLVGMAWIKNRKPGSADTTRHEDQS